MSYQTPRDPIQEGPTPPMSHLPDISIPCAARSGLPTLLAVALLGLWLATAPLPGMAEEPTEPPAPSPAVSEPNALPSEAMIALKQETLVGISEPSPTQVQLTALYKKIQSKLAEIESSNATAAEFASSLTSAPERSSLIRARLEADAQHKPTLNLPDAIDVKELSRLRAREAAERNGLQADLNDVLARMDSMDERAEQVRARLSAARDDLSTLEAELAGVTANQGSSDVDQAQRWLKLATREARRAEIRALEQERTSSEARATLKEAQRDELQAKLHQLDQRRQLLDERISSLRVKATEQARREAEDKREAAQSKHPLVLSLAEENAALGRDTADIAKRQKRLSRTVEQTRSDADNLEADLRGAQLRLEAAGMSSALGSYLIESRSKLHRRATLADTRKKLADIRERIAETTLRRLSHRDQAFELRDLDDWIDDLAANLPDDELSAIRTDLIEQAEDQRDLLAAAQRTEDAYGKTLEALETELQRYRKIDERFGAFVAERLLWVRSTDTLNADDLRDLPTAIARTFSPSQLAQTGQILLSDLQQQPWIGLLLIAAVVLWVRAGVQRRALRAIAEPLRRVSTDRFSYTLEGIARSTLLALPLALILGLVGWRISASVEASDYSKALGSALLLGASGLFVLRFTKTLCINGGIADRHFRWSSLSLSRVRQHFTWATLFLLPLGMLVQMLYNLHDPLIDASLGRLLLIVLLVGFFAFLAALLHPTHGAPSEALAEHRESWLYRTRWLWYSFFVVMPVLLALAALIGYLYTAGTLFRSLTNEFWLALGLVLLHQSVVRWLILTRRRLALQAALERRAAREAEREAEDRDPVVELLQAAEPEADLATLDAQTRKLLNASIFAIGVVGMYLIWADVLPAFKVLDSVALWHYPGVVDGVEQPVPMTIGDLLVTLMVVLAATVAARNLPGLLEILLLQSAAMSAGSRYALIKITRYVVITVAAFIVFSQLGFSWSKMQWLVAALGVGIGFGLQEIVANFISGLIILFERPVRVGDIVTIGDTTGVVTRVEIRATTIRNWDKQELLVPNKELITGRLLNWSLSDQINRIVITVGIEYGSDVTRALELLRQAAEEHPRVIDDPGPMVTMEGFGDNALTLVLRCYLDSLDNRLGTTSELHQRIDALYRDAAIGIAFPQSDIHVGNLPPLEIRLSRTPAGESDAIG